MEAWRRSVAARTHPAHLESGCALILLTFAHVLIGKPVPTFPGHALLDFRRGNKRATRSRADRCGQARKIAPDAAQRQIKSRCRETDAARHQYQDNDVPDGART